MKSVYWFFSANCSASGGVANHLYELIEALPDFEHNVVCNEIYRDQIQKRFKAAGKIIGCEYTNSIKGINSRLNALKDIEANSIRHFHDYSSYTKFGFFDLKNKGKHFITFHGWEGCFPIDRKIKFLRQIINAACKESILVGSFIEKWYGTKSQNIIYGRVNQRLALKRINPSSEISFVGRLGQDTGFESFLSYIERTPINTVGIFGGDRTELYRNSRERVEILEARCVTFSFHGWIDNPLGAIPDSSTVFTSGYLGILEALAFGHKIVASFENQVKYDYLRLSPFWEYLHIIDCDGRLVSEAKKISCEFDLNKYTWGRISALYQEVWSDNVPKNQRLQNQRFENVK